MLLVWILCLNSLSIKAAYLQNMPLKVTQPNGIELSLLTSGDEYHQRVHDLNGYTILRNTKGWYVFAVRQNGKLIPGLAVAGLDDPKSFGLKPGLDISAEEWKSLRSNFWDHTPKANKPSQLPTLTTGTVNNLVVFIRFSDQTAFPTSLNYYDSVFNDNVPGANSMYNYYKEASYNNMTVSSTFYPTPSGTIVLSYQDSHTRNYYSPWDTLTNPTGYKSNERTSREHDLLRSAVSSIASQVPVGLNLDFNSDGNIDNVCFIIRGGTTAWSSILWPHRWSAYTSPTVNVNGKHFYDYNIQIETFLNTSGVGVLAHEMFHTFGAPDLYHYTSNGMSPVGVWDIMDANQNPPQHMSAFLKYKYGGWIASIPTITLPGTYILSPLTSSTNNCYKIPTSASATEYFVLEYRRKIGSFESSLPGSGLVIYRINTLAGNGNADGPPDEVYAFRPGGTLTANGTISQGFFNNTIGRVAFNDTTNPRCFLSTDSNAHVNIYNISAAGNTISFQVGMTPIANFSAGVLVTCPYQTVGFSDISGGSITSRLWSFSPNTAVFVNGTSAASLNPEVQFPAAGNYSVTLTISGPAGSNTMTKSNYIHINNASVTPFADNFESGTFATKGWVVNNPDGQTSWAFTSSAAGNGSSTKSVFMDFYNYDNAGTVDELVSPGISLPQAGSAKLKFKVAYRPYSDIYKDSLKVAIYNNCGSTLAAIPYAKTYATLATGADDVNPFTPAVASDWRTDSIDLTAYLGQTIVVKFIAVDGYGNNLYLDDINLTSTQASVVANFSANNTSVCQSASVSFTDLSLGSPTSWSWTFGDGGTSLLQNPSHQYLTTGLKTVSLTVTKSGNSNTMTKTSYINVTQSTPVSVSILNSPSTTVCVGTLVSFTAVSVNGGTNPVYQWKVNDVNVGNNSLNYAYVPLNGAQVKCVVTSNQGCVSGNPATSNVISESVMGTPVVNLGNDTTIPASDSLMLDAGAGSLYYQWNSGETSRYKKVLSSGTYSVTVSNGLTCYGVDSINVKRGYTDIYGNAAYLNLNSTALDSVLVSLKSGNSVIQSQWLITGGHYHFINVASGTYSLEAVCNKTWGGANASDALLVLKHFVNIAPLTGVKLKAANVDNSASVNSLDAMLISRRFTGSITSFAAGNWVFEKPVFVFTGNANVTQNIKGLCTGDVNGSYQPYAKMEAGAHLEQSGYAQSDSLGICTIPLLSGQSMSLGALSMIMNFPSESYELISLKFPSSYDGQLDYLLEQGLLRISWFSLTPVVLKELDPVIELKVRKLRLDVTAFNLNCLPGTELADELATPFRDVKLSYPQVLSQDQSGLLHLEVFPNPSKGNFTLELIAGDKEALDYYITNSLGEKVFEEKNLSGNGHYLRQLDLSYLSDGMYFISMKANHGLLTQKLIIQGSVKK